MSWTIADKHVLITGGSSGIGKAAATELAARGARVTLTSRDAGRAETAAADIKQRTGGDVTAEVLDLSELASVRRFAEKFLSTHTELSVLVNNAGGIFGRRRESVDGNELTFATNHIGAFFLTNLLKDGLQTASESRVVNVSSEAHTFAKEGMILDDLMWSKRRYRMIKVYGHSKLANILHAHGINTRFGPTVSAYALHPGVVDTSLGARGDSRLVSLAIKFGKRWSVSASEGADTVVWLATEEHIDTSDGIYFSDRKPEKSTRFAKNESDIARLWEMSEQLTTID